MNTVAAGTQQVSPIPALRSPVASSPHPTLGTPSLSPSYTDDQRPFLCRKQKPKLFVGFFLCRLPHPQLLPLLPALAPGWKPSLHLSYCFKPKFTVSVGGQDPLSPPSLHPTLRTLLTSPLVLLGLGEGKRAEGRRWAALIPLGSGCGSPLPNPGLLPGDSPDPSPGPSPHHTGNVDSSQRAGKKVRLSTDPLWGTPT